VGLIGSYTSAETFEGPLHRSNLSVAQPDRPFHQTNYPNPAFFTGPTIPTWPKWLWLAVGNTATVLCSVR